MVKRSFVVRHAGRHLLLHRFHRNDFDTDVHHVTDQRRDLPADRIGVELQQFLASSGIPDAEVMLTTPTVEDVFIARMGAPPVPSHE